MKKYLFALMAGISAIGAWALDAPTYYLLSSNPPEVAIGYPRSVFGNEYDFETTEIVVPSTVTLSGTDYTVTMVCGSMFGYMNLEKVTIPATVRSVKTRPDDTDESLRHILSYCKEIVIEEGNPSYMVENNLVYSLDRSTLFGTPKKENHMTSLTVPEGTKYIASVAFGELGELQEVNLPESLEGIGNNAFMYCGIKSVALPAGLKFLDETSFGAPLVPDPDHEGRTMYAYRVEVKNVPEGLIYAPALMRHAADKLVYYGEELRTSPVSIDNGINIKPDVFPNLKTLYVQGMNFGVFNLFQIGDDYAAEGKEIPVIYANDYFVTEFQNQVKRYEENNGKPRENVPTVISTGAQPAYLPELEPDKVKEQEIVLPVFANEKVWLQLNTWLRLEYGGNQFYSDGGYYGWRMIESQSNPGLYYFNYAGSAYLGKVYNFDPQIGNVGVCRLRTQYYSDPALFQLIENEDGTVSIFDTEGYAIHPNFPGARYNIVHGQEGIDRYNNNVTLQSELNSVLNKARLLAETDVVGPMLVNSADNFRSDFTEPKEGSFANLLDDNRSTFWHSTWSQSTEASSHWLDIIFDDGQNASEISLSYQARHFASGVMDTNTAIRSAEIYWSTDGGATFSDDCLRFTEDDGLGQAAGSLNISLPVKANALRMVARSRYYKYWSLGELRLRDKEKAIPLTDEVRRAIREEIDATDTCCATGDFETSIARLKSMMEQVNATGSFELSGIDAPTVAGPADGEETFVEWYDLQGRKVAMPVKGRVYLRRSNTSVSKVLY